MRAAIHPDSLLLQLRAEEAKAEGTVYPPTRSSIARPKPPSSGDCGKPRGYDEMTPRTEPAAEMAAPSWTDPSMHRIPTTGGFLRRVRMEGWRTGSDHHRGRGSSGKRRHVGVWTCLWSTSHGRGLRESPQGNRSRRREDAAKPHHPFGVSLRPMRRRRRRILRPPLVFMRVRKPTRLARLTAELRILSFMAVSISLQAGDLASESWEGGTV